MCLEGSWRCFGRFGWRVLEISWGGVGRSLGCLRSPSGRLGGVLESNLGKIARGKAKNNSQTDYLKQIRIDCLATRAYTLPQHPFAGASYSDLLTS